MEEGVLPAEVDPVGPQRRRLPAGRAVAGGVRRRHALSCAGRPAGLTGTGGTPAAGDGSGTLAGRVRAVATRRAAGCLTTRVNWPRPSCCSWAARHPGPTGERGRRRPGCPRLRRRGGVLRGTGRRTGQARGVHGEQRVRPARRTRQARRARRAGAARPTAGPAGGRLRGRPGPGFRDELLPGVAGEALGAVGVGHPVDDQRVHLPGYARTGPRGRRGQHDRQPGLGPAADQVPEHGLRKALAVVEPGDTVPVYADVTQILVGGQDVLADQPRKAGRRAGVPG